MARRPKWLPALIAAHIVFSMQFERFMPARTAPLAGSDLQHRLAADAALVAVSIVASFVLLTRFVQREGGGKRPLGIITVCLGEAEDRHDGIADELFERAAICGDDAARVVVVTTHQCTHVFGV